MIHGINRNNQSPVQRTKFPARKFAPVSVCRLSLVLWDRLYLEHLLERDRLYLEYLLEMEEYTWTICVKGQIIPGIPA